MALAGKPRGKVVVEGLDELNKQIKALGGSTKDMAGANFRAAEMVRIEALPMVPVYRGNQGENKQFFQYKSGGSLRASLRSSKSSKYAEVVAGNARVPYANPIHWGWIYDKDWFVKKNIRPNLFIYRALGNKYQAIMANYEDELQKIIDKYGLGAK